MEQSMNESGQGMVEYALLLILIAMVVMIALTALGNSGVRMIYDNILSLLP